MLFHTTVVCTLYLCTASHLGLLLGLPPLGHLLPGLPLSHGLDQQVHQDHGGLGDPLLDPGDEELPGLHPVLVVGETAHPAPMTEWFQA